MNYPYLVRESSTETKFKGKTNHYDFYKITRIIGKYIQETSLHIQETDKSLTENQQQRLNILKKYIRRWVDK